MNSVQPLPPLHLRILDFLIFRGEIILKCVVQWTAVIKTGISLGSSMEVV